IWLIYAVTFFVSWLIVKLALVGLNVLVHYTPAVRRRVRPWMRRRGIDLLPPRRKRRMVGQGNDPDEILRFHERHRQRLAAFWTKSKSTIKRTAGLIFAICIFAWLLRRVTQHWGEIDQQVMQINPWEVLLASVMFSAFLMVFRMVTWWRI